MPKKKVNAFIIYYADHPRESGRVYYAIVYKGTVIRFVSNAGQSQFLNHGVGGSTVNYKGKKFTLDKSVHSLIYKPISSAGFERKFARWFKNPRKKNKPANPILTSLIKSAKSGLKKLTGGKDKPKSVTVVGELPVEKLETINYIRGGKHPGAYKHDFKSKARIKCLSNGALLIEPKEKGKKLWTEI